MPRLIRRLLHLELAGTRLNGMMIMNLGANTIFVKHVFEEHEIPRLWNAQGYFIHPVVAVCPMGLGRRVK